ncbi:hypothetical protein D3C85_1487130 [compost metagenome]
MQVDDPQFIGLLDPVRAILCPMELDCRGVEAADLSVLHIPVERTGQITYRHLMGPIHTIPDIEFQSAAGWGRCGAGDAFESAHAVGIVDLNAD